MAEQSPWGSANQAKVLVITLVVLGLVLWYTTSHW